MANAAALYWTELESPRPDLVIVRMGVGEEQKTTSDFLYIPEAHRQQEDWRTDRGVVVAIGSAIATKSYWGTELNIGDVVTLATASGDVHLIKQDDGSEVPYRIVSPLCILSKKPVKSAE